MISIIIARRVHGVYVTVYKKEKAEILSDLRPTALAVETTGW